VPDHIGEILVATEDWLKYLFVTSPISDNKSC